MPNRNIRWGSCGYWLLAFSARVNQRSSTGLGDRCHFLAFCFQ